MTLLVLGLSHHAAPFELLERVAVDDAGARDFERGALAGEHLTEALVLSTCNRTEVYAAAVTFHGALAELTAALAEVTGLTLDDLKPHLYVHYEERAVAHAFRVAAGLDSMAIGEAQILGQLRGALRRAQQDGHLGRELNLLFQQAFRVAKRVHTETDIDTVSHSLVDAAFDHAGQVLESLDQAIVLVVGAGGMGALAATTATRRSVGRVLVANRTPDRARGLADRLGAAPVDWAEVPDALRVADIVISSTGARDHVIELDAVSRTLSTRSGRPLVLVDLAMPRDIDPRVSTLDGVTLVDLEGLGADLAAGEGVPEVSDANALVTVEIAEYITARSADAVAPTVSALRRRADDVVREEMQRLAKRLPDLPEEQRSEVERAVHRVVEKLLHAPTVRVKQFAQGGDGGSYAKALSELFDLDPRDVNLVSVPVPSPFEEDRS